MLLCKYYDCKDKTNYYNRICTVHYEYKLAKKNLPDVEDLVRRKVIVYDHKAKTSDFKFSKEFKLKTLEMSHMPNFLQNNFNKYEEWFDHD